MTAVSKHSEIPETEDMTNRRSTPAIEAIEATLEPPEDEAARPSARANTVVINAKEIQDANGNQYMMVKPERQLPAYLLVCMGANVGPPTGGTHE